jgi:hypothetical protein
MTTLLDDLATTGGRFGAESMCLAGGWAGRCGSSGSAEADRTFVQVTA